MANIEILKSHCEIGDVASALGWHPRHNSGSYIRGDCPTGHDSQGHQCFVVWPEIQSFKCYSCDAFGDVIDLVQLAKGCDFRTAINWLANYAGVELEEQNPEQKAQYEEQKLVQEILTAGARFYHMQLMEDREMLDHLIGHYGLSKDTIDTYSLGYSTGEGLLEYLSELGYTTDQVLLSGLFVKLGSKVVQFFDNRLIFPYWRGGHVAYAIGRKTTRTPDNKWENGKYKKLLTRNEEKRPHISEHIKNSVFYGEDSIRGADTVFVAEGVTDCLNMLQAGYATISPVTTRFRSQDQDHLVELTKHAKTVYLVPDNEGNQAGVKGAMDTAARLEAAGKSVYMIELPRPEDVEKIDVTDFLRDSGKEAFAGLVKVAKTPLQLEIDQIAGEKLSLIQLSDRWGPVKAKLAGMPQDRAAGYFDYMKKTLHLKADFIRGLAKEMKAMWGKGKEGSVEGHEVMSALFPGLVDLVIEDGKIAYLYKDGHGYEVKTSVTTDTGTQCVPPGKEGIPFEILPVEKILKHLDGEDASLYWLVFEKLKTISVLPSTPHYHLCAVYVFFTYVAEASPYYPYLWFFGLPERGKSRIAKAITNLSHRGFYTETLNEAHIFRFADLFRGTLTLDLYEISERAKKKGSHDLLLGRYERGMKVARVTAPDKGPFRDTQYFRVSGPTVLASNVEISPKDPLRSRCIKITMPEARGTYPNNNGSAQLSELKARMLAFRARHLGDSLPEMEKPIPGRLGDIIHPLLCTSKLLPNESTEALYTLIGSFEEERAQAESESLAGKIAEALWNLQHKVSKGRIPFEELKNELNKDVDEKYQYAPQTIGRELSAMGIERKKSDGVKHIIFDEEVMKKIFMRFNPSGEIVPNVPDVSKREMAGISERDEKKDFVPDVPESGDERDITKNSSLCSEPATSMDRDDRDDRDESSKGCRTHTIQGNDQKRLFERDAVVI